MSSVNIYYMYTSSLQVSSLHSCSFHSVKILSSNVCYFYRNYFKRLCTATRILQLHCNLWWRDRLYTLSIQVVHVGSASEMTTTTSLQLLPWSPRNAQMTTQQIIDSGGRWRPSALPVIHRQSARWPSESERELAMTTRNRVTPLGSSEWNKTQPIPSRPCSRASSESLSLSGIENHINFPVDAIDLNSD